MLRVISDLEDHRFNGRTVSVRVDFNVSITNGSIGEDYRIQDGHPDHRILIQARIQSGVGISPG